jgi:RNA polymerase sigma-70 factor (ECF subfamily)
MRIVGNLADAEEVVDEAVARWLPKGSGSLTDRIERERPLLFTIVRHVAVTALRRRRPMLPLECAQDAARSDCTPRSEAIAHAVGVALLRLPASYREAVELHYLDGLRLDAVAARMHVSAGVVRGRLSRAMCKLRTLLTEDLFSEGAVLEKRVKSRVGA